ncbi:hypothetical protein MY10362_002463 [Beauveria mimosiformis]
MAYEYKQCDTVSVAIEAPLAFASSTASLRRHKHTDDDTSLEE